jgi:hypothetical protein
VRSGPGVVGLPVNVGGLQVKPGNIVVGDAARGRSGAPGACGGGAARAARGCLSLAEVSADLETRTSLVNLAQGWVRLAEQAERREQQKLAGYRAKAWECLSLAEGVNDPERRADLRRFAGMWMSLTEPIKDPLRGAYELPHRRAA